MGGITKHQTDTPKKSSEIKVDGITKQELENILSNYKPRTWLRFIARYSLGLFFESFKYSWPLLQLQHLLKDKKDTDLITKTDIIKALQATSIWDFQHSIRTTKLEQKNFFDNTKQLDTDGVIEQVLYQLSNKKS